MNHPSPLPTPRSHKDFKICDVTMTPCNTTTLFTPKLERLESCLVNRGLKLCSLQKLLTVLFMMGNFVQLLEVVNLFFFKKLCVKACVLVFRYYCFYSSLH